MAKKPNHHDQSASPDSKEIESIFQNTLSNIQSGFDLDTLSNDLTSEFLEVYQTETQSYFDHVQAEVETFERIMRLRFPDLLPFVLRKSYTESIEATAYKQLARILNTAWHNFKGQIELPYIKKAKLPLTVQLDWLNEDRILNAAGKYFPMLNYIYSRAPIYPSHAYLEQAATLVKGYKYQPPNSEKQYHVAIVATSADFWTGALKVITPHGEQPLSTKHGQKILKRFINAHVFERVKTGPRSYALVVGYYRDLNNTNFYKVPLATKRLSAGKLRKFKLFFGKKSRRI